MNQNKGFTLIEMLVVVAIIGLLSSVVLTGLGTARVKARDARRLSDVRHIQNALEIYYSDNDVYPTLAVAGPVEGATDMTSLQRDPQVGSYYYLSTNSNQNYTLGTCLEKARSVGTPHESSACNPKNIDIVLGCRCDDADSKVYCVEVR